MVNIYTERKVKVCKLFSLLVHLEMMCTYTVFLVCFFFKMFEITFNVVVYFSLVQHVDSILYRAIADH